LCCLVARRQTPFVPTQERVLKHPRDDTHIFARQVREASLHDATVQVPVELGAHEFRQFGLPPFFHGRIERRQVFPYHPMQRLGKGVVLLVHPWPPLRTGGDVGQRMSAMRAACHCLPLSVRGVFLLPWLLAVPLRERCVCRRCDDLRGGATSPFPAGITAGSDGNLWFIEGNRDIVARMTPLGVFSEFPTPSPDSETSGIGTAPDGKLWFTEYNVGKIGCITASSPGSAMVGIEL